MPGKPKTKLSFVAEKIPPRSTSNPPSGLSLALAASSQGQFARPGLSPKQIDAWKEKLHDLFHSLRETLQSMKHRFTLRYGAKQWGLFLKTLEEDNPLDAKVLAALKLNKPVSEKMLEGFEDALRARRIVVDSKYKELFGNTPTKMLTERKSSAPPKFQ